uniref:Uncharacterized protein n=1 Tax=Anopheles albimanus TaxID=7167 RepID=A0A182FX39_ANOAL
MRIRWMEKPQEIVKKFCDKLMLIFR